MPTFVMPLAVEMRVVALESLFSSLTSSVSVATEALLVMKLFVGVFGLEWATRVKLSIVPGK